MHFEKSGPKHYRTSNLCLFTFLSRQLDLQDTMLRHPRQHPEGQAKKPGHPVEEPRTRMAKFQSRLQSLQLLQGPCLPTKSRCWMHNSWSKWKFLCLLSGATFWWRSTTPRQQQLRVVCLGGWRHSKKRKLLNLHRTRLCLNHHQFHHLPGSPRMRHGSMPVWQGNNKPWLQRPSKKPSPRLWADISTLSGHSWTIL